MQRSLKIALILETSGGGSGRHVLELATGLGERGHDVTVIWSPLRAESDFVKRLEHLLGVRGVALPMRRAVGPTDLRDFTALVASIQQHGPFDILHGHSSKAGALLRLLPDRVPGTRIYTPHAFYTMNPDLNRAARLIYGLIERGLSRRVRRIIVVSAAERDHALGLGIPPEYLRLVVNGARPPDAACRAAARRAMDLSDDEGAVGFVGRLTAQKDPLRFVQAIAHAAAADSRIRGIVIGEGPLCADARAAASGVPVRFLGWRDAPLLMPGLDLFCMTSRYEAMPYTLIDALHAGLPIVSTQVGGTAETLREGENGLLLPPAAAAEDIGHALRGLIADADRRAAFAAASSRMARALTIDAMVEGTLAVYRQARSTPRPDVPAGGLT